MKKFWYVWLAWDICRCKQGGGSSYAQAAPPLHSTQPRWLHETNLDPVTQIHEFRDPDTRPVMMQNTWRKIKQRKSMKSSSSFMMCKHISPEPQTKLAAISIPTAEGTIGAENSMPSKWEFQLDYSSIKKPKPDQNKPKKPEHNHPSYSPRKINWIKIYKIYIAQATSG